MLAKATDGALRGRVETDNDYGVDTTIVRLSIIIPALNNYHIVLCKVHQSATQYPAIFVGEWGKKREPIGCDSAEVLESTLLEYCESAELQQIVAGLLAQADQA